MAEQQLIDYIKAAKKAGQADEETRGLLIKNSWTETEVNEAFATFRGTPEQEAGPVNIQRPKQTQPQLQPQPLSHRPIGKAEPEIKSQAKQPEPREELKSKPMDRNPIGEAKSETKPQPQEAKPTPRIVESGPSGVQPIKPEPVLDAQPRQAMSHQQAQQLKYQPKPQRQPINPKMKPRKKSHLLFGILISLIIVIFIAGGGIFVASQIYNLPLNPLEWNLFTQTPEKIITKMVNNMKSVKSSKTNTKIELIASEEGIAMLNLLINLDGKMDITDTENPKGEFSYSFSSNYPLAVLLKGNIVFIDKSIYSKIDEIEAPDEFISESSDPFIFSKIVGRWLIIDNESVKTVFESNSNNNIDPISKELIKNLETKIREKVKGLLFQDDILIFVEELDGEIIAGQDTYHYFVKIDNLKLKNLVEETAGEIVEEITASGVENIMDDATPPIIVKNTIKAVAGAFMDTAIDIIGDINIEMWIGKEDYMLYRYKINESMDFSKILPMGGPNVSIKIEMNSSDFNVPVSITAPEGAEKAEDFFRPFIEASKIEDDLFSIRNSANNIFAKNKSYRSLCNRGFLNGYQEDYGEILINLNNSVISNRGASIKCLAGINSFCLSTKLENEKYMCVDESGSTGTVRCTSINTICQ